MLSQGQGCEPSNGARSAQGTGLGHAAGALECWQQPLRSRLMASLAYRESKVESTFIECCLQTVLVNP